MTTFNPTKHLLSHRLHGFGPHEGSLSSLESALSTSVRHIEIDTRVTGDGELMVLHDAKLDRVTNSEGWVREFRSSLQGPMTFLGEPEEPVPSLDAFLEIVKRGRNDTIIFIDIKDHGTETEHIRLVEKHDLVERTWFLSWIPEVLARIHQLNKNIPICFCYLPLIRWKRAAVFLAQRPRMLQRIQPIATRKGWGNMDEVHFHINDFDVPVNPSGLLMERGLGCPIHLLQNLPDGNLGSMIRASGGGIGLTPPSITTPAYLEQAREEGFRTLLFHIDTPRRILDTYENCQPDFISTDRADLFEIDWAGVKPRRRRKQSRDAKAEISPDTPSAPA